MVSAYTVYQHWRHSSHIELLTGIIFAASFSNCFMNIPQAYQDQYLPLTFLPADEVT